MENGIFRRVGGVADITVNVSVRAATNRNLADAIAEGRFREALFYRLNVIPLHMPPLRERPEDIPLLLDYFFHKFSGGSKKLSPDALRIFIKHPWKGNVRELEKTVERVVLLSEGAIILPEDLPEEFFSVASKGTGLPDVDEEGVDLEKIIEGIEKDYLHEGIGKVQWQPDRCCKAAQSHVQVFQAPPI